MCIAWVTKGSFGLACFHHSNWVLITQTKNCVGPTEYWSVWLDFLSQFSSLKLSLGWVKNMKTENSKMLFSVFTLQTEFEFSGISVNLLTSWSPPLWLFLSSKVSLSNPFSITSPSSFFFLLPKALSQQDQKRKGTPANRTEPKPETRDRFNPIPPPPANEPEKENHKTMIVGAGSAHFRRHHQSESLKTPRPWSPELGFDFVADAGFYFYFDEWVLILSMVDKWVLLMVAGFC